MKINKDIVLAGILIVLLLAAGFFWFFIGKNGNNKTAGDSRRQSQQTAADFKVDTKELGKTQALAGFPDNLPQEAGGTILKNTESRSSDGRLQSTKKFTSKLSAQAALVKYADFFKQLGWVSNTKTQPKSPALFVKNQDILMITTTKDPQDTIVEVTIIQKTSIASN